MNRRQAVSILGLKEPFTEDELKKQYRLYAKKYHPDNHLTADEEQFKKVKDAYEFLVSGKADTESDASMPDGVKPGSTGRGTPCVRCNGTGIRRERVKTPNGFRTKKVSCQYCNGTGIK